MISGAYLKRLREQQGYTMDQVANRLNVSTSTVSRWENKDALVEYPHIAQLAKLYSVTPKELMGDEWEVFIGSSDQENASPTEEQIAKVTKTLSDNLATELIHSGAMHDSIAQSVASSLGHTLPAALQSVAPVKPERKKHPVLKTGLIALIVSALCCLLFWLSIFGCYVPINGSNRKYLIAWYYTSDLIVLWVGLLIAVPLIAMGIRILVLLFQKKFHLPSWKYPLLRTFLYSFLISLAISVSLYLFTMFLTIPPSPSAHGAIILEEIWILAFLCCSFSLVVSVFAVVIHVINNLILKRMRKKSVGNKPETNIRATCR